MINLSYGIKSTIYFCSEINEEIVSVLVLLIGVSILVAVGFLIAFIWSVRSGQYEDDYTPSVRMLFDNEPIVNKNKEEKSTINK